jgi:plastocyanin
MRPLLGVTAILAAAAGPVTTVQQGAPRTLEGTVRVLGGSALPAVVYVPGAQAGARADTGLIDQLHLRYVPTITVVAPGSAVRFRNSDPVVHNVFSPSRATGPFDVGRYGPDEARLHTFARPGAALVLCRIHPEMFAYVFVIDAYAWTQTDAEGRFRLDGVPADATQIIVWHPRAGTRRVTVGPGATTRLAITLGSP